jgi:biopolymer transport protein ExbB/TolQ
MSVVNAINRLSTVMLRSPLLWGALFSVGFFAPIETGAITNPDIIRYFAGHWVNYIETIAFFVALSALGLKALDVASQLATIEDAVLSPAPEGGETLASCPALVEEINQFARRNGEGYLSRRLRTALNFMTRKGSADTLEDEIKHLSDLDAAQAAQSYGFVKIIIWAIPILGFLGTVIGITMAIANLNPKQLEQSLGDVTGGLGVAFDTTALALGLSMVLMFVQFVVDKFENRLLSAVDGRMITELLGRFKTELAPQDPLLTAVKRMVDAILPNTERLVIRQAELWHSSMEAASARWIEMSQKAGRHLESSLEGAIGASLKQHAVELTAAEKIIAEQNRRHWGQVQQALEQTTKHLAEQQTELTRQTEVLLKVVEATGEITQLEDSLNRNLNGLAGAKYFEETVLSLSAAIQLLSARLSQLPLEGRSIELPRNKPMVQAA